MFADQLVDHSVMDTLADPYFVGAPDLFTRFSFDNLGGYGLVAVQTSDDDSDPAASITISIPMSIAFIPAIFRAIGQVSFEDFHLTVPPHTCLKNSPHDHTFSFVLEKPQLEALHDLWALERRGFAQLNTTNHITSQLLSGSFPGEPFKCLFKYCPFTVRISS